MINYIEIYEEIDNFLLAIYNTEEYNSYIKAHNLLNNNQQAKVLQLEIEKLIEKIIIEKEQNNYSKTYNTLFKEYNNKLKVFYNFPEVITVLKEERRFQNLLELIAKDLGHLFTDNINIESLRTISLYNDKCSSCSVLKD